MAGIGMGIFAIGESKDPLGAILEMVLMFAITGCIKRIACRFCPDAGLVTEIKNSIIKKSMVFFSPS